MHGLVTGATGFVGRPLVEALLARGCQIRAVRHTAVPSALMKMRQLPYFWFAGWGSL